MNHRVEPTPTTRIFVPRGRLGRLAPARPIEVLSPGLVRTRRLVLRAWREGDRAEFRRVLGDSRGHLEPFAGLMATGESIDHAFDRQVSLCAEGDRAGTAWRRGAFLADGRLAGAFNVNTITRGLEWEGTLNWWVARDVAGQGLGTEGVCALVDHALADLPAGLGLQRVTALIAQENLASVRVASRAGLRRAPGLRVSVDDGTHESLHDVYTLEVRATGT